MFIFTVVTFQNSCKWFVVKLNTLHNYYGIFIDNICYFRIPFRACQLYQREIEQVKSDFV